MAEKKEGFAFDDDEDSSDEEKYPVSWTPEQIALAKEQESFIASGLK